MSDTDVQEQAPPPWLSRFQRVTSSGSFLPEIDGLRLFAIGLVFLYHVRAAILDTANGPLSGRAGPISYVVDQGFFGVQLFFAISGFILALPFARARLLGAPRPRLRDYYARRLSRLEPPYVLSLVLLLFWKAQNGGLGLASLLPSFAASVLYVHNIVYDRVSAISGVAWSLEVEVQFYLLAPLFGAIFALRSPFARRALFSGIAISAVLAQTLVETRFGFHFRWIGTLPAQIQYFMVGMLVADVHTSHPRSEASPSRLWDAAAVLGLVGLGVMLHRAPFVMKLGVLPAMSILYLSALRGHHFTRILRAPVVSTLGGMCYSIYLVHTSVISLFYPTLRQTSLPASYPLRFLLFVGPLALSVIVVAGAFFVLVERPCMRRDWPARLVRLFRGRAGEIDAARVDAARACDREEIHETIDATLNAERETP